MPEPARSIAAVCEAIGEVDEGLRVRPWCVADAPVLVAAWNDPEVARWNPVPPDTSAEFAERWIAGTASQTESSVGVDVVLVDTTDVVLGEVGLQVDRKQNMAEVGFWLTAYHRGTGRGAALLTAARRLAAALELRGVVALVDPENVAAVAVLESCGWQELPTKSNRRAFGASPG